MPFLPSKFTISFGSCPTFLELRFWQVTDPSLMQNGRIHISWSSWTFLLHLNKEKNVFHMDSSVSSRICQFHQTCRSLISSYSSLLFIHCVFLIFSFLYLCYCSSCYLLSYYECEKTLIPFVEHRYDISCLKS